MKNVIKLAYIDVVNIYQQDCQHSRLPVVHLLWNCSLFCLTGTTRCTYQSKISHERTDQMSAL